MEKTIFSNGVAVINCTPHPIRFQDGENLIEVAPCGATLKAATMETIAGQVGAANLVRTEFVRSPEGDAELAAIRGEIGPDVLIVGSIISAQAWPGQVVGSTPAPGFERVPPDQKRARTDKFTTF